MSTTRKRAETEMCEETAPGVYRKEVGKGMSRSNVYFVRSGASWVLIDAGSAGCARLIQRTAESLFGPDTRATSILLTHHHPDHAGAALELSRSWDCPVYVHRDELPLAAVEDLATVEQYANPLDRWIILPLLRLSPRRRVESMLSKSSLKQVVQAFDTDDAVPGLPDWRCIHMSGHTPGHVAFFRSRDRVLITGDAVLTVDLNSLWGLLSWVLRRSRQKISGPPWFSTWNGPGSKQSVAALARLEPRVLASGHGAPIRGKRITRELQALAGR